MHNERKRLCCAFALRGHLDREVSHMECDVCSCPHIPQSEFPTQRITIYYWVWHGCILVSLGAICQS